MDGLTERELCELFKSAIGEEFKAQSLYRKGTELAGGDTKLGKMFQRLEEVERGHERIPMEGHALFKTNLGGR